MPAELESEERWTKALAHPNSETVLERLAKETLATILSTGGSLLIRTRVKRDVAS